MHGLLLGETLIKVEPNKMKWVVKLAQKRNLTHPYNEAWGSKW